MITMLMEDEWTPRLSELLDGELSAEDANALETHLTSCVHCARTLVELRSVVARIQVASEAPLTQPPVQILA